MALNAIIHRKHPSWSQRFLEAPCSTLAKTLYAYRQQLITPDQPVAEQVPQVKIVCVSDTHNSQPNLPPGDVVIHAGDMTQGGTVEEIQMQLDWLNEQPHPHKIVIAGNHDIALDKEKASELGISAGDLESVRWGSITYLQHSAAALKLAGGRSLTLFGHPSTRRHGNWAFQYDKGADEFTLRVEDDTDVLVTHSAPQYHLDVAGWGDEFLLRELWRVKPRLHVFGHIHGGYGRDIVVYDQFERLYEQVCAGSAGLMALIQMALLLLRMAVNGYDRGARKTILINASAVGGTVDQEIRKPQIVSL